MIDRDGPPVLVVEDSDEDWDTACQVAREGGYERRLQRAASGDDCLAMLVGTPPGDGMPRVAPALLLLDLNLPGLDGRDVLKAIQNEATLSTLPIVVFTTSTAPRDITFCYAHGANAVHVKPVRYPEHREALQRLFEYWLGRVRLPISPLRAR